MSGSGAGTSRGRERSRAGALLTGRLGGAAFALAAAVVALADREARLLVLVRWASCRPALAGTLDAFEPGEELGMAFDGLTYVNGNWRIFPKPYRLAAAE